MYGYPMPNKLMNRTSTATTVVCKVKGISVTKWSYSTVLHDNYLLSIEHNTHSQIRSIIQLYMVHQKQWGNLICPTCKRTRKIIY